MDLSIWEDIGFRSDGIGAYAADRRQLPPWPLTWLTVLVVWIHPSTIRLPSGTEPGSS